MPCDQPICSVLLHVTINYLFHRIRDKYKDKFGAIKNLEKRAKNPSRRSIAGRSGVPVNDEEVKAANLRKDMAKYQHRFLVNNGNDLVCCDMFGVEI